MTNGPAGRAAWWVVFRKELRETLRDRRTLLMMIVVPVLLYPALLVVSEQLLLFGQRTLAADRSPVALLGDAPRELMDILAANEDLEVVDLEGDPTDALRDNTVAAVAVIGPAAGADGTREVTLLFDRASDRSQRGRAELGGALDDWRDSLLADRLSGRGLPRTFAVPVAVSDSSVALPAEMGGYTMGRVLPMLLVVITLLGAFYPAIDLAAGEKERGTLETLLTAPVPASAVVTGKFVTVALIGVIAAALNLASMLLTFQTGMLQMTTLLDIEVALPAPAVAAIFLTLVPLAVLFAALFLGLAVRAASFKEAQNTLTPVYMIVLVPAMLPLFPGISFGPVLAVTPIAGVAFFFRDLMAGQPDWGLGLLVLASTTLYAAASLAFAAHAFGDERVLFGSGSDAETTTASWLERVRKGGDDGRLPEAAAVLAFVAFVAVLFFFGGIRLQLALGESGLLASEWLLLFLPAIAFTRFGGYDVVRALSLRAPSARALGAAVLLIAGGIPLVWLIGWLQTFVLPIPWEMLEGLEQLVTAESLGRFLWLMLLLAVTPALCEETVFRGVLLGGTRTLEPWRRIVLNGVVFGAFHLSFETVIRFLPTAALGALIAWAVWRTGSLWVGALMHFLNNGSIVAMTSVPVLRESLSDPDAPPPVWLIPLGALVLAAGVWLLPKRSEP